MSLLVKGITKLSELTIDADKDWNIKGIDSLGYVIVEDGAGHYFRLPSLTTVQRDALTPAVGMTIWNSDNTRIEKYDGSDWGAMGIAGVTVRKNTRMPVIGNRPQLNLIEGAAIGINIADNPPDDEIDITVSAKYPTRFMTLIPEDASLPTANPAAKATVDGTNFAYDVLDFDHTTEESANWEWFLTPDYLSENIVVDIFWESAGAGDAKFGFSVLGREKGETWDAALGVERTVVTTNLGAGKLNKSRITTFAPGWSPGDVILFKLARKAGDVADTIDANDVRVLKLVVSYTGQFAQAFYPLTVPVDITPGSMAWVEVDLSPYIPAGATGAILHFENTLGSSRYIGARKKGSTDDYHVAGLRDNAHTWAMCGCDEQRKIEIYIQSIEVNVFLVGYTATGVVFFDNSYNKTPGVFDSYQTVDCSGECPSDAIGLIFELINTTGAWRAVHIRKPGSTDDFYRDVQGHTWVIVGCDASQNVQVRLEGDALSIRLIGYVFQGAVFKTNMPDISPGSEGSWIETDLSAEAPSAVMVFALLVGNPSGIRKNGAVEDISRGPSFYAGAFVACDSGQKVEIKIADILFSFVYLSGYAQWAGA